MANNRNNYETKMKIRAAFFIIIFLIMIAVIIALLNGMGISLFGNDSKEEPEETSYYTSVTAFPQATASVTATPAAVSTPTPTPAPTEELEIIIIEDEELEIEEEEEIEVIETYGQVLKSGSMRSNTGVGLNIVADWTAVALQGGKAEITVTVSLESYGIVTISQPLTISVGGESTTIYAQAVNYDGNMGLKKNELGTQSFTVDLAAGTSMSYTIAASWIYNGTYSNQQINTVSCEETVVLER